jgi:predicted short-subunit dehydrogenase-like oxidoreductase (DUF2520 family)
VSILAPPSTLHRKNFRVSLVGAGALGSALAKRLSSVGYAFSGIINRSLSDAEQLANAVGAARCSDNLAGIPADTNLLLLTVPDTALQRVCDDISKQRLTFHQLIVSQFSGSLTTDSLQSLVKKGATGVSIHPFQTFPKSIGLTDTERLFKCYFGVQANDLEGVEFAKRIVHDLGGKVMMVPKEAKTLYHIGGVMASNYLVTLASLASEVFAALGVPPSDAVKVFEPIMRQTLSNIANAKNPIDALTGPIERGDVGTIKRHIGELSEQVPHLVPIYAALAIETVRVAIHKGSISQSDASEMLNFLEEIARRESAPESPSL